MAKTKAIKTGKFELPDDEFENPSVRISILLPLNLIKDLKKLSLTEEHMGKYQALARDLLIKGAQELKTKPKAKSKAG